MISLDKLILDFKRINSINSISFKNEKIEDNSLVLIGKFIDSYNSYDDLNELLLLEIDNKSKLNILNIEVNEFIKNYELNNIFFHSLDRRKLENEILSYYDKYVLFSIKLKKKNAFDKYIYFQERIKENAKAKITEEEKRFNASEYQKVRKNFEDINEEISKIDRYVIYNMRYIYFKYKSVFNISNHIKINLNKSSIDDEMYFDMYVLGGVYKLCNNYIFNEVNEDVFRDFFNLKRESLTLIIRNQKKNYVHYVIKMLYISIKESDKKELWLHKILENFGWDLNEHKRRRNYLTKKIKNISMDKNKNDLKNIEIKLEEFDTDFNKIIGIEKNTQS